MQITGKLDKGVKKRENRNSSQWWIPSIKHTGSNFSYWILRLSCDRKAFENTYYSNLHKVKGENLNSAVLMKEIECLKITIYIYFYKGKNQSQEAVRKF